VLAAACTGGFLTREKLVAAALVEKIAAYADAAEQALAVADPWQGFAGFVLAAEGGCGERGTICRPFAKWEGKSYG